MRPVSGIRPGICLLILAVLIGPSLAHWSSATVSAQDDNLREGVLTAIERAQKFLIRSQRGEGSWEDSNGKYDTGVTALTMLALLSSKVPTDHDAIKRGLGFLRGLRAEPPSHT